MLGWRSRASQLISGAGSATQVCREGLFVPHFFPFTIGGFPCFSGDAVKHH